MTSYHTTSMSRGNSAPATFAPFTTFLQSDSTYPIPPPMDRHPRASQLPKSFLEREHARRLALIREYELELELYGSSSSSLASSSSSSSSFTNNRQVASSDESPSFRLYCPTIGSDYDSQGNPPGMPTWVYELAFGLSDESKSECDSDCGCSCNDESSEGEMSDGEYYRRYPDALDAELVRQRAIQTLRVARGLECDSASSSRNNTAWTDDELADSDSDGDDDDDDVWGVGFGGRVPAVPPMLMKRQLASSGRRL